MNRSATRRWTINGDFLALRPNGVVRYAKEVTTALDHLVAEEHPLTRDLNVEVIAPCPAADTLNLGVIPIRVLPEFSRPRLPQFWVQMQLPRQVNGGLLSFCNLGPVWVPRQIVCIHDLQTRLAPESYGRGFRIAHRVLLPILGRQVGAVATVSEFSRSHLINFGVVPEHKLVVTYNGHEHAVRWDATSASLEFRTDRPFVLALARKQRHKNHELLHRVAEPLCRMGIDLCIAGDLHPSELVQDGSHVPDNIRFLGRVSDNDLARALDHALCFLLPSRIEGFGLPALEAMARGCPVIVSRTASLPEICANAALYAAPDDEREWIEAIRRLKDDESLRQDLRRIGLSRAQRYSWRRIAETYLEMMATIDAQAQYSTVRGRLSEPRTAS